MSKKMFIQGIEYSSLFGSRRINVGISNHLGDGSVFALVIKFQHLLHRQRRGRRGSQISQRGFQLVVYRQSRDNLRLSIRRGQAPLHLLPKQNQAHAHGRVEHAFGRGVSTQVAPRSELLAHPVARELVAVVPARLLDRAPQRVERQVRMQNHLRTAGAVQRRPRARPLHPLPLRTQSEQRVRGGRDVHPDVAGVADVEWWVGMGAEFEEADVVAVLLGLELEVKGEGVWVDVLGIDAYIFPGALKVAERRAGRVVIWPRLFWLHGGRGQKEKWVTVTTGDMVRASTKAD
ncbi:hypothetical protein DFH06DRAFT_372811 [Mycena polygramma]|nr:hypothetical protein DFH06DRAFT_372811 [Mycena polygramma]